MQKRGAIRSMLATKIKRISFLACAFVFAATLFTAQVTYAQRDGEVVPDSVEIVKSKVLEVIKQDMKNIRGTDAKHVNQTIRVRILEGKEADKELIVENDFLNLKEGEVFYLRHTSNELDGSTYYSVDEPYRLPQVFAIVALFLVAVFVFGGIQGVRGIVSLIGSLVLILYVLLPGILSGYSPLLVTIGVSSLIIIVGSYITHGFNKTTTSAVLGMVITVLFTGLLAYGSVFFTKLSGFGSEEVIYLNLNSNGNIDVIGILLGGIMIGLLGVLYDVAIGQAISVEELARIAPHVPRKFIYQRAIRIGREHIGALVNTLAIAYVGVALPLLLLFSQSATETVWVTINREIFSTEIVRTMIGSIGLILAVPITTLVAIKLLMKKDPALDTAKNQTDIVEKEKEALAHAAHGHSHGHSHDHA